jgi:hypothetical protein
LDRFSNRHTQDIYCKVVIFESKFHPPLSGYLLPCGHFGIDIPSATLRLFTVTLSFLDRNSTRYSQAIKSHVVIFESTFHPPHSGYLLASGRFFIEISPDTLIFLLG